MQDVREVERLALQAVALSSDAGTSDSSSLILESTGSILIEMSATSDPACGPGSSPFESVLSMPEVVTDSSVIFSAWVFFCFAFMVRFCGFAVRFLVFDAPLLLVTVVENGAAGARLAARRLCSRASTGLLTGGVSRF